MIDVGEGMLALLGTAVTTMGGVIVLLLTQRASFRKMRLVHELARQDILEKNAQAALVLARKADDNAGAIQQTLKKNIEKQDQQLEQIHLLVNSRLARALAEIAQLKVEVMELRGMLTAAGVELSGRKAPSEHDANS